MKIRLSLLLLMLQLQTIAFALTTDRDQPLNVEADHVIIDDKKGTMVYTGQARFTQGSIVVTADKVQIYSKNRIFSRAIAIGKPATFQQKLDDGKIVKARAHQMEYRVEDERLILTEEAEVWQDSNHIRSDRIVYQLDTQVIDAQGEKEGSRVKITIQPESIKDPQK
jgi:lipopolysaccharide export system protein LptA